VLNSLKRCAIFSSRILPLEFFIPPLFFLKRNIKPTSKKIFGLLFFSQKVNNHFFHLFNSSASCRSVQKVLARVSGCQSFWLPEFLVARVSGCQSFWLPEFLVARVSGCQSVFKRLLKEFLIIERGS